MKISYNWLKRYLDCDLGVVEMGELLTEIGLETEKIHQIGGLPGGLKGVVAGKVTSCVQHPNADRLRKTQVDVGGEELLDIVCGAPNVAEGQTVLVATVGTVLYPADGDSFKIKKSKIRGEVSMGMICAEDELGIGSSHDGIMVLEKDYAPGTAAADIIESDLDHCFEIGLTPNRADAMSHYGVARDLHAALTYRGQRSELNLPSVEGFSEGSSDLPISLKVEDTEGCPHYYGLLIDGLEVKESPEWLKKSLEAIDLKPINNVVDVTNFVLHETGHPLHAFDYAEVKGNSVIVKTVAEETSFTTLDEKERSLNAADLMICNAEAPMCIAGVFGGLGSGVKDSTKTIFLESAYFHPVRIRKTAKRHGLNTDASFRYERGVDPNMSLFAMKRAAQLFNEVAGGKVASVILEEGSADFPPHKVNVQVSRIQELAGHAIPKEDMLTILQALEIEIAEDNGDALKLLVPAYKVDVIEQADIVEEVLRIYGLDNIPIPDQMLLRADPDPIQKKQTLKRKASEALVAFGFQETLHNSLHKSDYYSEEQRVSILNPLSNDLDVLRNSAMPAGLETLGRNIKHRITDLKIFEFGRTYHQKEGRYFEKSFLSLWVTGSHRPENWDSQSKASDVSTLKEGVYRIAGTLGIDLTEKEKDGKLLFKSGKQTIGFAELISPKWRKAFEIDTPVYYAELDWEILLRIAGQEKKKVRDVPRFPGSRRDLALLVDQSTSFAEIERTAINVNKNWIRSVGLFDVYEGKGLPEGKISYAINLWLQDDTKTLTDQEVDKTMEKVLNQLKKVVGAELRQ